MKTVIKVIVEVCELMGVWLQETGEFIGGPGHVEAKFVCQCTVKC